MWGRKANDRASRASQAIERIDAYIAQLQGIRGRFVETRHAFDIGQGDQARLQQAVMEIRDYFGLRQGLWPYGGEIVRLYNAGKQNYLESSCLDSVDQCLAALAAARQRVVDDPGAAAPRDRPNAVSKNAPAAIDPEKVTIRWLVDRVPASFWITAASVVVAIFLAGFATGSSAAIRTLLGLK